MKDVVTSKHAASLAGYSDSHINAIMKRGQVSFELARVDGVVVRLIDRESWMRFLCGSETYRARFKALQKRNEPDRQIDAKEAATLYGVSVSAIRGHGIFYKGKTISLHTFLDYVESSVPKAILAAMPKYAFEYVEKGRSDDHP